MSVRVSAAVLFMAAVFFFGSASTKSARAETTNELPSGTHDMLDWMTLDSNLRGSQHMAGSANPMYTNMATKKFYWTKGGNGSPWDIQRFRQPVHLFVDHVFVDHGIELE
jgi:hypothetical protein